MSQSYGTAFAVTTAGYTGSCSAFISIAGQSVTFIPIKGSDAGLTITAVAGQIYPIKTKHIKPASSNVIALN